MKVNNSTIRGLLDTGSGTTLLRENMLHKLNLKLKPVDLDDPVCLFAAEGSPMQVLGSVEIKFYLSGLHILHTVYVVSNMDEALILGRDFMRQNGVVIDYVTGSASVYGGLLTVPIINSLRKETIAKIAKTTCIQPFSHNIVMVKCANVFRGKDVVLEPIANQQFQRCAVGRTLATVKTQGAALQVVNIKPHAVILNKGTRIATVSAINVAKHCTPFKLLTDEKQNDQTDFQPSTSEPDLGKFIAEYGFTIGSQLSAEQRQTVTRILYENKEAFARSIDEQKVYPNYQQKLELQPAAKIPNRRPYKLKPDDEIEAEQQIKNLEAKGLVERATQPVPFAAPVFVCDKFDENKRVKGKRLLCDYRNVNQALVIYSLPNQDVHQLLRSITTKKSQYYSQTDMAQSFHSVALDPSTKHLASFWSPKGIAYTWNVCPFGLSVSPYALQVVTSHALAPLLADLSIYLFVDDILITEPNFERHVEILEKLLKTIKANNLCLNSSKTKLFESSIKWLGFIISQDGISINEERCKIIQSMGPCRDRKSVSRLLGMLTWNRKFIPNLSKRSYHLRQLMKTDKKFEWTDMHKAELDDLKTALTTAPILAPINVEKDWYLFTDASREGLGSCMVYYDDEGRPVTMGYAGRCLSESESKLPINDLELLAVLHALLEWRPWSYNKHITIVTDNVTVLYMNSLQLGTARQRKLVSQLMQFNLSIRHLPGSKNYVADAISRAFSDMTPEVKVKFLPSRDFDSENLINVVNRPTACFPTNSRVETCTPTDVVQSNDNGQLMAYEFVVERDFDIIPPATCSLAVNFPDEYKSSSLDVAYYPNEMSVLSSNSHSQPEGKVIHQGSSELQQAGETGRLTLDQLAPSTDFHCTIDLLARRDLGFPHARQQPPMYGTNGKSLSERCSGSNTIIGVERFNTDNAGTPALQATREFVNEHESTIPRRDSKQLAVNVIDRPTSNPNQPVRRKSDCTTPSTDRLQQHAIVTQDTPTVDPSDSLVSPPPVTDETDELDLESDRLMDYLQQTTVHITATDYVDDSEFSDMYQFLTNGELSGDERRDKVTLLTHENFVIENDQLFKLSMPQRRKLKRFTELEKRLCIPNKFQREIIEYMHNNINHYNPNKLFLSIKGRVYFKNLFSGLANCSQTCALCCHTKRNAAQRHKPLWLTAVPQRPWELVHFDIKNLTRKTKQGNVAILVICDAFSRFPIFVPIPDMTAITCAKAIVDHQISIFGVAKVYQSDRGSQWMSEFFKTVAELLGVKHRVSAALCPTSNALAETQVHRLIEIIRIANETDMAIETTLQVGAMGLRAVNNATLISPYECLFGYPMPLPCPVDIDCDPPSFNGDQKAYVQWLKQALKKIHEAVKENDTETKQQVKDQYDKRNRVKEPEFCPGQLVLLLDKKIKPGSPSVISHKAYKGPYYVTSKNQGNPQIGPAYELVDAKTNRRVKSLISADRLKPYDTDRSVFDSQFPRRQIDPTMDNNNPADSAPEVHDSISPAETPAASTSSSNDAINVSPDTNVQKFEPARRIVRERKKSGKREYLVEFVTSNKADRFWWCNESDVTPILIRKYILAKNRKKKNSR